MSSFTDKQKEIIDELIKFKEENAIDKLQTIRLLRRHAGFLALKWESKPRESVVIYTFSGDEAAQNKYYETLDFLYFVKRLIEEGYVMCQLLSRGNTNDDSSLIYDRKSITYRSNEEALFSKQEEFWAKGKDGSEYSVGYQKEITYIETVKLFKEFEDTIIYPLDTLIDLKRRDYMTVDQFRYKEQLRKERRQSSLTLVAAILPAYIGMVSLYFSRQDAEENSKNLNSITEAIQQSKIEIPASIAVSHTDTLQINEINSENNSIKGVGWELSKLNKTLETTSKSNSKNNL